MFHIAPELRIGYCGRIRGYEDTSQQEFGKGVATCSSYRVLGCVRLERKDAARELVTHLIEILSVVFETEFKRVLAMDPRNFVGKLHSVVIDRERTIVGVADRGEPPSVKHGVRNSPGNRSTGALVRDADVTDDVAAAGAQGSKRVKETRITETGVIHQVRGNGPRVGAGVLFVVG